WGFTKPYSEETAKLIDMEVQQMVSTQYERAKSILAENAEKHHQLGERLLESEVIYSEDMEHIFGKRPWVSRSQEILNRKEEVQKSPDETPKSA
ncbi:MAG: cell division protein FtsH, partial [Tannerella sp.]|nr:cell division protein FtsH [Tannerella sp.]